MGGKDIVKVLSGFRLGILRMIWMRLHAWQLDSPETTGFRATAYRCLDTTSLRPFDLV